MNRTSPVKLLLAIAASLTIFLVGWTYVVDNFYSIGLDQTTFRAPNNADVAYYDSATNKWKAGPVSVAVTDASATNKGVTKLSVAPASATNPIAVGTNDTRMPAAPSTNGAVLIDTGAAISETAQGAANTLLHGVGAGTPTFSQVVNADVSATAAIALTKLANAAANSKLVGSGSAGAGSSYTEITIGTNLSMTGTTLSAAAGAIALKADASTIDATMSTLVVNSTNFAATNTSSSTDYLAIATSGVTNTCLAADAVTSAKILDGTIATADIANSAVTLAKVANAAASSKWLGSGSSGSGAAYTENTFDATTFSLSSQTLYLATGGVTSGAIADGTIVNADISASAGITGGKIATVPDSLANVTAATNMTLAPTGNHLVVGGSSHAVTLPSHAGAPTSYAVGDQFYDSTQKCMMVLEDTGNGTTTFSKAQVGLIFSTTADSGAIGASSTSNVTFSNGVYFMPANSFTAGKKIRIRAWMAYSTSGNPFLNANVYFQGFQLWTGQCTTGTGVTNDICYMDVIVTCRTAGAASTAVFQTSGVFQLEQSLLGSVTLNSDIQSTNTATNVSTTAVGALSVGIKFGSSNASNSVTLKDLTMEVMN